MTMVTEWFAYEEMVGLKLKLRKNSARKYKIRPNRRTHQPSNPPREGDYQDRRVVYLPSTISEMESEDEEKNSKAAPVLTVEGEVPCVSPPVDEDERYDRVKIICDPTTTSMKIPTMLD